MKVCREQGGGLYIAWGVSYLEEKMVDRQRGSRNIKKHIRNILQMPNDSELMKRVSSCIYIYLQFIQNNV